MRKRHLADYDLLSSWANTEVFVLLEHFAAGLGVPAFFTCLACVLVCGPWKPQAQNVNLKAEIIVLFVAFVSILAYAVGESWHEAAQLTLSKRSNFGQFLKDYCIPAQTIEVFGACSKQYFGLIARQLAADGLGMLTFVCVFSASFYCLKRDAPAS